MSFLVNVFLHPLSTVWTVLQLAALVLVAWAAIDVALRPRSEMGRNQKIGWLVAFALAWLLSAGLIGAILAAFYLFAYRKHLRSKSST